MNLWFQLWLLIKYEVSSKQSNILKFLNSGCALNYRTNHVLYLKSLNFLISQLLNESKRREILAAVQDIFIDSCAVGWLQCYLSFVVKYRCLYFSILFHLQYEKQKMKFLNVKWYYFHFCALCTRIFCNFVLEINHWPPKWTGDKK